MVFEAGFEMVGFEVGSEVVALFGVVVVFIMVLCLCLCRVANVQKMSREVGNQI